MEILRLLSDLFPVPGQQIRPKGTRRRLLFDDRAYGPRLSFPFFGKAIYSYPTNDPLGENAAWKTTILGVYSFVALSLAIASFSCNDLLIMYLLSFGQSELYANSSDDAWYRLYNVGYGISGITGWLAGYLLARVVSSRRTWACLGGVMVLQNYIHQWWAGRAFIAHDCHFTTLLEGFIAGVFLEYFGPKPKPFAFIKRHVGKFVLVVMAGYLVLPPLLEYMLPNPPGYVDQTDPKNKAAYDKREREMAEEVNEKYRRKAALEQQARDEKQRIKEEQYAAETARLEAQLREMEAVDARNKILADEIRNRN